MLNQQSEKQSSLYTTQNWIAEPYLGLTQILCQLVDFLGKSNGTSIQVLRKPRLEYICLDTLGCQPSKQSKPSRRPLQPMHWECHGMIACTHHAAFWCGDFGKNLSGSSMEHDYHLQTAGFFLVHTISRGILGYQNALIEVCEPAVIAAQTSLEPLHNYSFPRHHTVFIRIPASKLTTQTLRWQHFPTLPDWYLPAERGMVHWRSFGRLQNPFAWSPQLKPLQASSWFKKIWTFQRRWTAFSFWLAETTTSQAVCSIIRGETAFRQAEHNVESVSSSGSVVLLLAIRILLQRLTGCC